MKHARPVSGRRWLLAGAGCMLSVFAGCVLQRGIDFGHWAQSGEDIPLIRFVEPLGAPGNAPLKKVALLPVLGGLAPEYLAMLDDHLLQESKFHFRVPLLTIDRQGKLGEYVTQANMLPMGDVWNTREAARLGQLVGVSHVLCSRVRSWQPYQPQQLVMDFALVETAFGATVLEMNAMFDARSQTTLLALDKYLRNRSARPYNRQNLDIILRSPAEYSGFVTAQCMGLLAEKIWDPGKLLKPGRSPADGIVAQP